MVVGGEAGGPTVALFHATTPAPRPIRRNPRYGDIGVAKLTFAVSDLDSFCRDKGSLVDLFFAPKTVALANSGEYHFAYGRDPEGNLLEFVSGSTPVEAAAPDPVPLPQEPDPPLRGRRHHGSGALPRVLPRHPGIRHCGRGSPRVVLGSG